MLGWAIAILMFAIILGVVIADPIWQRWALSVVDFLDDEGDINARLRVGDADRSGRRCRLALASCANGIKKPAKLAGF